MSGPFRLHLNIPKFFYVEWKITIIYTVYIYIDFLWSLTQRYLLSLWVTAVSYMKILKIEDLAGWILNFQLLSNKVPNSLDLFLKCQHTSSGWQLTRTFKFWLIIRYGETHPYFYMGPLTEAIKEAGGASAKEVNNDKTVKRILNG